MPPWKFVHFKKQKDLRPSLLFLLTNESSKWTIMLDRELLEAYLLMFAPCSPPLEVMEIWSEEEKK